MIIDGQQMHGGYNYDYAGAGQTAVRSDTSVSGWQLQALKASRLAGSTNEKLEEAVTKAISFLKDQAFTADGTGFVYASQDGTQAPSGASWTMTGVGCLCLQLLGQARCPQVKKGLEFLQTVSPEWPKSQTADQKAGLEAAQKAVADAEKEAGAAAGAAKAAAEEKLKQLRASVAGKSPAKASVYGWYYVTQAKFQAGGEIWDKWNKQFSRELVTAQLDDGHWENGDHESGTQVYTTALCVLMLEVYYRYLPSYNKVEDVSTATEKSDQDEVSVKVLLGRRLARPSCMPRPRAPRAPGSPGLCPTNLLVRGRGTD